MSCVPTAIPSTLTSKCHSRAVATLAANKPDSSTDVASDAPADVAAIFVGCETTPTNDMLRGCDKRQAGNTKSIHNYWSRAATDGCARPCRTQSDIHGDPGRDPALDRGHCPSPPDLPLATAGERLNRAGFESKTRSARTRCRTKFQPIDHDELKGRNMKTTSKSISAAAATLADPRWAAVVARDPPADGTFFYSVRTTGVYCRPSVRRAPRAARERRVPRHAGRRRARRLSRLQALQAGPACAGRAARGHGRAVCAASSRTPSRCRRLEALADAAQG